MLNGKRQIEFARERLVREVNRLVAVRRNVRSRKVNWSDPRGPGRWEGQREEQGRDVRVGLRKPSGDVGRTRRRVEGLEVLSELVKGQVAVIIDDTVDHKEYSRGKDVSPHGNYWIYCHAHGRFERAKLLTVAIVDLSTGRTFMVGAFPYAVRKMLDLGMVIEFKTEIDLAREMLDVLKGRFR